MRVKGGTKRKKRHKKVLKATKGYRMTKSKLYRVAHESYMHAGQYSYNDRRKRKGQMKSIWIDRINAAAKANGTSYSKLMNQLSSSDIQLNRKMLSEIAVNDPESFSKLLKSL